MILLNVITAMIISVLPFALALTFAYEWSNTIAKLGKKKSIVICILLCIVGMILFLSLIFALFMGKHCDLKVKKTTYDIEKLTFNYVYFNGDEFGDRLDADYISIEEPDSIHNNVVIVEKQSYSVQWLFKIPLTNTIYKIYMSEDVYEKFNNCDVIYTKE